MASTTKKLAPAKFVGEVIKDPKAPTAALLLYGYPGESSETGHTRLYFDPQLSHYVEIPDDAILHSQDAPSTQSPLGGTYVWIKSDAQVIHSQPSPKRQKGSFLEGGIVGGQMGSTMADCPATHVCLPPTTHCTNPPYCVHPHTPNCPPHTPLHGCLPPPTLHCPPLTVHGPECPAQTINCPTRFPVCGIGDPVAGVQTMQAFCPYPTAYCPPPHTYHCPPPHTQYCPPPHTQFCPPPVTVHCPPLTAFGPECPAQTIHCPTRFPICGLGNAGVGVPTVLHNCTYPTAYCPPPHTYNCPPPHTQYCPPPLTVHCPPLTVHGPECPAQTINCPTRFPVCGIGFPGGVYQ
jgi:hypothetical protein